MDLQKALHHVYDAAGYAYHIYSGPPEPGLAQADGAWASQLLALAQSA
jgi:hypothetical protein